MKKLIIWFAILVTLPLIFISHLVVFGVTDTNYEKSLRSLISSTVRNLSTLDSDDFQNPVVSNQTYLIDNNLIAMTNKLVYTESEDVILHSLSGSPGEFHVFTVDTKKRQLVGEGVIPPNKPSVWTTANSLHGFETSLFDSQNVGIPSGYSGWMQIEVTADGDTQNIPLFIQSEKMSGNALFIEGTNTLMAYNSLNNLRNNYTNPYSLSGEFSRPSAYPMNYFLISPTSEEFQDSDGGVAGFSCAEHLANADFAIKSQLENKGLKLDLATDQFLSTSEIPENYDLLIFGAHNEYWSSEMFSTVEKFVERGGSVLFMGGNTAWRATETSSDGFQIFWGNGFKDPDKAQFIDEVLGTYWDMRGYATNSSFTLQPAAEKFSDGLMPGYIFGEEPFVSNCRSSIEGISGHETDKLRDSASSEFILLAKGNNPWNGGADVVFRETPYGGFILNFSSTGTWHGNKDVVVNNLIDEFLSKASK